MTGHSLPFWDYLTIVNQLLLLAIPVIAEAISAPAMQPRISSPHPETSAKSQVPQVVR